MVFAYGVLRIQERPRQPAVRIGLAATDRGIGTAFNTENEGRALPVARAYADRTARLAHEGAQVVILPEKLVGVTPADSEKVLNVFSAAARARSLSEKSFLELHVVAL